MQQNSLIYCHSISGFEEYRKFVGNDGQIFFDSRANTFTFRNGFDFETATPKEGALIPDKKFQIHIKYMISHHDNTFLARISLPCRILNRRK